MRALREAVAAQGRVGGTIVLIDAEEHSPPGLDRMCVRAHPPLPDDEGLRDAVRSALAEIQDVDVELTRESSRAILANLRGLTRAQARQAILEVVSADKKLDGSDIAGVLKAKRRSLGGSGLLEFVESPADMNEIGGLSQLKRWLKERDQSLSERARLYGITPPRGILLLGVQGAGKSLCAKAVATAWQRPLLRLDPGVLYDRYVGESERRLRDALRQTEAMSPVVLWIDEIEKAFASAAAQSTDGGLSQRMFGTLLTWMQEHDEPVFMVATANNIEALPPELLRKGRFDEIFFVDLPDAEARKRIFEIHLRRRRRNPDAFDLDLLSARAEGYSGAEIEQCVVAALHTAFSEGAPDVTTEHLVRAVEISPPLSRTMAERLSHLRRWAQGRCVPAD